MRMDGVVILGDGIIQTTRSTILKIISFFWYCFHITMLLMLVLYSFKANHYLNQFLDFYLFIFFREKVHITSDVKSFGPAVWLVSWHGCFLKGFFCCSLIGQGWLETPTDVTLNWFGVFRCSSGKCDDQASDWNSCLMFAVMGIFIKLRVDVGVNGGTF